MSVDIEDAAVGADLDSAESSQDRLLNKALIFPKHKHNTNKQLANDENKNDNMNVPGTQTVWLKTYGCSHNVSDSEYMEVIQIKYLLLLY